MTPDEFERWHQGAVRSYAADIARATGLPDEAAWDQVRAQDAHMFPDGRPAPDNWLMMICDDSDSAVGTLWIGRHPERADVAYIYDIEIEESRRGEGLGRAAMLAAEQHAEAHGLREIGLNVFGFNERAQGLYSSLGYRVVSAQMTKRLG